MAEPAPRFVRAWTLRMVWRQGSEADWNWRFRDAAAPTRWSS